MQPLRLSLTRKRAVVLLSSATALGVAVSAVFLSISQHSAASSTTTLKPVADAYVSNAQPHSNYGSKKDLRTGAIPAVHSYLRFTVKTSSLPVAKATLRLWSDGSSPIGYLVRPVDGSVWDQHTITASTAPPYGEVVAASGPLSANSWTAVDVTDYVSRAGDVTFALTSSSRQSITLESSKSPHPPELVVQTRRSASAQSRPSASPGVPPVVALRGIIEEVTSATGYRYGLHDDADHSMDSLKVVESPKGGYLGVYHSADAAGVFHSLVATSSDITHWTFKADLDSHASQPTIKPLSDGGFLLVEESDNKGVVPAPVAWLRFLHYSSLDSLLTARPDRKFDAPHTLVGPESGAEGTPDVYSVSLSPTIDRSTIQVDFHYFKDGLVDQPARGTLTNFSTWSTRRDVKLATAILGVGGSGGLGDRDETVFQGLPFTVAEVAATTGAPWEPYLYDDTTGSVIALKVNSHGGSTAFGNPTATPIRTPSGAPAIVVTMFIPKSGAAPGEAGELIYYREYGGAPIPVPTSGAPTPNANGDAVIATAGDVACLRSTASPTTCHQGATAGLIRQVAPAAVLALGDEQYETGTLDGFGGSYDPTWGQFKSITKPVPGNHEYQTAGASGYYTYFGAAAGDPTKGYYSYDIGSWHMIALNGNCSAIGGCGPGAPEERWLAADLASKHSTCTLAYWHQPRFSSGEHGNEPVYDTFWKDLYAGGADVVLNGHDHDYERFAPQTPSAQPDPSRGIREFVVGTGGKSHYDFPKITANSEVRNADTFGILQMTLHPRSYDWQFLPEPGSTFTDSGTGTCH
jgi:hypothetical protein